MSLRLLLAGLLALAAMAPAPAARPTQNQRALSALSRARQTENYSFVVTGDNRDGDAVFAKILRRARDYSPRFMLHTGDFVPAGGEQDYLRFLGTVQAAPFPVLPVLGNHDVVGRGRQHYTRLFGPAEFAFSYGRDRFIFVDNSAGKVTAAQRKRLAAELKKPARYRFVIMHMPPGNVIWFHAFTDGSQETMRTLEAGKADLVFLGHIHIFDKMEFQGVKYIVSGGAGAPLYRMPLYFSDRGGAFHHFTLIQVNGQGISDKVVEIK